MSSCSAPGSWVTRPRATRSGSACGRCCSPRPWPSAFARWGATKPTPTTVPPMRSPEPGKTSSGSCVRAIAGREARLRQARERACHPPVQGLAPAHLQLDEAACRSAGRRGRSRATSSWSCSRRSGRRRVTTSSRSTARRKGSPVSSASSRRAGRYVATGRRWPPSSTRGSPTSASAWRGRWRRSIPAR